MSDSDVEVIGAVNEAVARGNPAAIAGHLHEDVVWEHNIGVGSPDEGVYRGRESVVALMERIVEAWESIRPVTHSIDRLDDGRYRVRGELVAKHRATNTEIRTPYEQLLEVKDGEMVKGVMKTGEIALP